MVLRSILSYASYYCKQDIVAGLGLYVTLGLKTGLGPSETLHLRRLGPKVGVSTRENE